MKLTEKRLREIVREELTTTDKVDEIAPVIAAVARQAAASAIADKVSEQINENLVPQPEDLVKLVSASADMYGADEDDEHTSEGFMGAAKELVESAISKIAGDVAKDAVAGAVAKKLSK